MRYLDAMGVPYRVIVEAQEHDAYAAQLGAERLLVLDPAYQRDYDACMVLAPEASRGSGPARNFAWDTAVAEGHAWHWVVDDNIQGFYRLHHSLKVPCGDGTPFRAMEDFTLRYENIGMSGPNYYMFAARKDADKQKPIVINTRLFSCILIRNSLPFRWRCRYNEDLDLSLRVLKAGWATVQFNAFLQHKATTQTMGGGNTAAFYAAEGTLPKSRMIAALHPDVSRVTWRFNRWHHHVDFSPFKARRLIRRPDAVIPEGDPYGLTLVRKPAA